MASAFPSCRPTRNASSHTAYSTTATNTTAKVHTRQAPPAAQAVTTATRGAGDTVATGAGTTNAACAAVHADPAGAERT